MSAIGELILLIPRFFNWIASFWTRRRCYNCTYVSTSIMDYRGAYISVGPNYYCDKHKRPTCKMCKCRDFKMNYIYKP